MCNTDCYQQVCPQDGSNVLTMPSLPDIQGQDVEDLGDQIHQFWLAFSVSYVQQNVYVVKRLEVVEVVTGDIQGYYKTIWSWLKLYGEIVHYW